MSGQAPRRWNNRVYVVLQIVKFMTVGRKKKKPVKNKHRAKSKHITERIKPGRVRTGRGKVVQIPANGEP